tara:strand:+ start:1950 stop:3098 length:1149 start_codon:yes stop_codon:yes gene_type:complete
MPTVEDIIVQRYQMTLEDFIARGPQIVPAYYGRIINAINAEDSEELQKILIEMDGGVVGGEDAAEDTIGIPSQNDIQNQINAGIDAAFTAAGISISTDRVNYVYDPETGTVKQLTLPSAFPKGFAQLYNPTLQPELIAGLHKDLERAGVVEPGYFDDETEFGEKTQNVLNVVLEYADANYFIDINSEEGQNLIEEYGDNSYGYLENEADEVIFARAILDKAIIALGNDVRQQEEIQKKLQDEAVVQSIASRFVMPTDEEMDEFTEEMFQQLVGRLPTAAEKDRYATRQAELNSSKMKNLIALEKAIQANEIFKGVEVTKEFEGRDITVTEDRLNPLFQVVDPEAQAGSEIASDLEGEISAIERGNAYRRQQAALLDAMFGQI